MTADTLDDVTIETVKAHADDGDYYHLIKSPAGIDWWLFVDGVGYAIHYTKAGGYEYRRSDSDFAVLHSFANLIKNANDISCREAGHPINTFVVTGRQHPDYLEGM